MKLRFYHLGLLELLFFVLAVFLIAWLSGCAGRIPASGRALPEAQAPRFWHGCEETIPARADGFRHFVCRDVHEHRWEVLVRIEPKR